MYTLTAFLGLAIAGLIAGDAMHAWVIPAIATGLVLDCCPGIE